MLFAFFEQDEDLLRENVERFKELIRYASLLGASMVAAEVGRNEDGSAYTERDWKVVKEAVRELADEAGKWGVFVLSRRMPKTGVCHRQARSRRYRFW